MADTHEKYYHSDFSSDYTTDTDNNDYDLMGTQESFVPPMSFAKRAGVQNAQRREEENDLIWMTEYADDILSTLLESEKKRVKFIPNKNFDPYRRIMVRAMGYVASRMKLQRVTYHFAVYLLDYYIEPFLLEDEFLRHLVITCLKLAAKTEDTRHPRLTDFNTYIWNVFNMDEYKRMEKNILKRFGYNLCRPTVATFAEQFSHCILTLEEFDEYNEMVALKKDEIELILKDCKRPHLQLTYASYECMLENVVNFMLHMCDICLTDVDLCNMVPSRVAIACMVATRRMLLVLSDCSPYMKQVTHYDYHLVNPYVSKVLDVYRQEIKYNITRSVVDLIDADMEIVHYETRPPPYNAHKHNNYATGEAYDLFGKFEGRSIKTGRQVSGVVLNPSGDTKPMKPSGTIPCKMLLTDASDSETKPGTSTAAGIAKMALGKAMQQTLQSSSLVKPSQLSNDSGIVVDGNDSREIAYDRQAASEAHNPRDCDNKKKLVSDLPKGKPKKRKRSTSGSADILNVSSRHSHSKFAMSQVNGAAASNADANQMSNIDIANTGKISGSSSGLATNRPTGTNTSDQILNNSSVQSWVMPPRRSERIFKAGKQKYTGNGCTMQLRSRSRLIEHPASDNFAISQVNGATASYNTEDPGNTGMMSGSSSGLSVPGCILGNALGPRTNQTAGTKISKKVLDNAGVPDGGMTPRRSERILNAGKLKCTPGNPGYQIDLFNSPGYAPDVGMTPRRSARILNAGRLKFTPIHTPDYFGISQVNGAAASYNTEDPGNTGMMSGSSSGLSVPGCILGNALGPRTNQTAGTKISKQGLDNAGVPDGGMTPRRSERILNAGKLKCSPGNPGYQIDLFNSPGYAPDVGMTPRRSTRILNAGRLKFTPIHTPDYFGISQVNGAAASYNTEDPGNTGMMSGSSSGLSVPGCILGNVLGPRTNQTAGTKISKQGLDNAGVPDGGMTPRRSERILNAGKLKCSPGNPGYQIDLFNSPGYAPDVGMTPRRSTRILNAGKLKFTPIHTPDYFGISQVNGAAASYNTEDPGNTGMMSGSSSGLSVPGCILGNALGPRTNQTAGTHMSKQVLDNAGVPDWAMTPPRSERILNAAKQNKYTDGDGGTMQTTGRTSFNENPDSEMVKLAAATGGGHQPDVGPTADTARNNDGGAGKQGNDNFQDSGISGDGNEPPGLSRSRIHPRCDD